MSSVRKESAETGSVSRRSVGLLDSPVEVVNVGLEGFYQELKLAGVPVVHVSWSPPANGDPKMADILSKLGA
jgi:hypothetical protein